MANPSSSPEPVLSWSPLPRYLPTGRFHDPRIPVTRTACRLTLCLMALQHCQSDKAQQSCLIRARRQKITSRRRQLEFYLLQNLLLESSQLHAERRPMQERGRSMIAREVLVSFIFQVSLPSTFTKRRPPNARMIPFVMSTCGALRQTGFPSSPVELRQPS